ncbi:granzyme B(G,H) [Esox lucius]|uniref:trypsin n=1 Tax=Esox lucius TaxID=8010 RepID=A0A6Q2YUJ0_ESOLU|nr:granzyme B(G,H) [Esox lucius]
MMLFRVLSLWVFIILPLYLQEGDCTEIIGGHEVKPHSLPYTALLENFNSHLVCGGMLINRKWVLTAAHCLVWGFPWKRDIKTVHLGVHSLKRATRASIQSIEVEKNVPHPDYNAETYQHDIMLLKLKKSVKETNNVRIKPLPKPVPDIKAETKCFVAGWGRTKKGGAQSDVLLSVNVTVIDRKKCSVMHKNETKITNEMLCVGYQDTDPPAAPCQGDSGGPLVCGGELRGVVSSGEGCGREEFPGVYTFISKYDEWIKETIRTSE